MSKRIRNHHPLFMYTLTGAGEIVRQNDGMHLLLISSPKQDDQNVKTCPTWCKHNSAIQFRRFEWSIYLNKDPLQILSKVTQNIKIKSKNLFLTSVGNK